MLDKEKAGVAAPVQISRLENADSGTIPQAALETKLNAENMLTSRWQDHELAAFNSQYDTNIDNGDNYHTLRLGTVWLILMSCSRRNSVVWLQPRLSAGGQ